MKSPRSLPALILATLLAGCVFAYYATRNTGQLAGVPNNSAGNYQALVDTSMLQTALNLTPLAGTPDEQGQAREAWRLADHELDLAFGAALREAQIEASLATQGPLRELTDRIAILKKTVDADKKRVKDLGNDAVEGLDVAQAQLDLDQDELDDAQQELATRDGGKRARLQRLLQEHEASEKAADQTLKFGTPGATGTLSEQLREWLSLRDYESRLQAAARQAAERARAVQREYNALAHQPQKQPESDMSLGRLRQMSAQQKTLTGLVQRAQDATQLVIVYQQWSHVVANRQRTVMRLILRSLAASLSVLLVTVLLNSIFISSIRQTDRRRLHQLRLIARVTMRVIAALLILLILVGPPTQLSTMIGLVTAAVTVVMKDFIVAFFGWFTLMGKNGISVGDWVEIEGVSGEVIEIGLLKTVLLELGNWTESGHPTGRRVAFSNSFALEHHYFNFSTTGQWLWDELQITLPAQVDPYQTAEQIRGIVEHQTEGDAAEAAKDWQNVTRKYGARQFSAAPYVSLRPGGGGLTVVVRYITHAPKRNAVKAKIFQDIIDLLRNPA